MSAAGQFFTADLTVDELALMADAGWEPLSVVSGDCTYNPGKQASSMRRSKELHWITNALTQGQLSAIKRMRTDAAGIGAEGIVGVRLAIHEDVEVGDEQTVPHFAVMGTAVRRHGGKLARGASPFTCHLSGQDTWALLDAGCMPLGLVVGFSVYHSRTKYRRMSDVCEMPEITEAVYAARELAMSRMQSQATQLKANGVVGVTIDMKLTPGPTFTFKALGTAISTARAKPIDKPGIALALAAR